MSSLASPSQKQKLLYPLSAPEWRAWSNPEILMNSNGLRLDEISEDLAIAILHVLEATLSPEGYEKALSAMRINHFLGELVKAPAIVVAPFFIGAEPNIIDDGPFAGTRIQYEEEELGLQLVRSLRPKMQATAQIYKEMHDPAMPEDRWNKDDQRHLCGAFRDNRIVPYEGVRVSELDESQQSLVMAMLEQYLLYLPHDSRKVHLETKKSHFSETYFSWIGGFGLDDPFYFRIQSPVVIVEFDHHSSVFLTNGEPAKFHIHTILRLPNQGDYGYAIRRQLGLE